MDISEIPECEQECYEIFNKIRWSNTNGNPVCPKCESFDIYKYNTRKVFKCSNCESMFSSTTGTIFTRSKLPFNKILSAIDIVRKGSNALDLSKKLDIQYKAAHSLHKKIETDDLFKLRIINHDVVNVSSWKDHYSYVKQYRQKNKEKIDEKRREKRKLESEYNHFMKQLQQEQEC